MLLIIGGVELMNLMSQGFSTQVANLAHLGGCDWLLILRGGPRMRDFIRSPPNEGSWTEVEISGRQ